MLRGVYRLVLLVIGFAELGFAELEGLCNEGAVCEATEQSASGSAMLQKETFTMHRNEEVAHRGKPKSTASMLHKKRHNVLPSHESTKRKAAAEADEDVHAAVERRHVRGKVEEEEAMDAEDAAAVSESKVEADVSEGEAEASEEESSQAEEISEDEVDDSTDEEGIYEEAAEGETFAEDKALSDADGEESSTDDEDTDEASSEVAADKETKEKAFKAEEEFDGGRTSSKKLSNTVRKSDGEESFDGDDKEALEEEEEEEEKAQREAEDEAEEAEKAAPSPSPVRGEDEESPAEAPSPANIFPFSKEAEDQYRGEDQEPPRASRSINKGDEAERGASRAVASNAALAAKRAKPATKAEPAAANKVLAIEDEFKVRKAPAKPVKHLNPKAVPRKAPVKVKESDEIKDELDVKDVKNFDVSDFDALTAAAKKATKANKEAAAKPISKAKTAPVKDVDARATKDSFKAPRLPDVEEEEDAKLRKAAQATHALGKMSQAARKGKENAKVEDAELIAARPIKKMEHARASTAKKIEAPKPATKSQRLHAVKAEAAPVFKEAGPPCRKKGGCPGNR